MSADTIEDTAAAAGLTLPDDVVVEIDEDESLAGRGLYGYTWPDNSRITLYPDAFADFEQLLRTLVHELLHVAQVRSGGQTTNSVTLAIREREAYAEEERWWQSFLERR